MAYENEYMKPTSAAVGDLQQFRLKQQLAMQEQQRMMQEQAAREAGESKKGWLGSAAQGAAAGSMISPGWGTAIGGIAGGLLGAAQSAGQYSKEGKKGLSAWGAALSHPMGENIDSNDMMSVMQGAAAIGRARQGMANRKPVKSTPGADMSSGMSPDLYKPTTFGGQQLQQPSVPGMSATPGEVANYQLKPPNQPFGPGSSPSYVPQGEALYTDAYPPVRVRPENTATFSMGGQGIPRQSAKRREIRYPGEGDPWTNY